MRTLSIKARSIAFTYATILTFLPGCLVTKAPVLNETNSVPGISSDELKEYTLLENQRIGAGVMHEKRLTEHVAQFRVSTVGALTLVQVKAGEGYVYYGVGALSDGTPLKCSPNTKNTKRMRIAESRFGIELEVAEMLGKDPEVPNVLISGERKAIAAYLIDEFKNGNLVCEISGRPAPGG